MKKYKVTTGFIDKNTGDSRYTGQIIELEADRAKQLKKFVEELPGQKEPKPKKLNRRLKVVYSIAR